MTTMRKDQICEMLWNMSEMTRCACEGTLFVEVITYVKNHCPGIEPEFVEVFRDALNPIMYQKWCETQLARLSELERKFANRTMSISEFEEYNDLVQELGL